MKMRAGPLVVVLLGLFARTAAAQEVREVEDAFRIAAERAPVARECLIRARAVLEGWWALRDPGTGLLPRRTDHLVWAPQDNAADLFPFLVLAAHFTAPERLSELRALYRSEIELTTRLDGLPDWYAIPERRFLHAEPDVTRIVFGATEYAKDGLNPLIELLGPDPWSHRMRQLVDGVLARAPVPSDFGLLPSDSTEVNGELLQVLTRFHFLTGDDRYLESARRIGDAYCLEVLPANGWLPAHRWDFASHRALDDTLSLNDHGNEIIGGLVELYAAERARGGESAARYETPLRRMFDALLAKARNEDGLWYARLEASTGEVLRASVPDTWGYALAATLAFGLTTGDERYVGAARHALRHLDQERYLEWGGADAFADSIEGALLLLAHLPEPAGFAWLERVLPRFFAKQKLPGEGGTGIVEGWYGDGNYARTALMVALCYSRGTHLEPWNTGLSLGGMDNGGRLYLTLGSEESWSGRLCFDRPRHRDHFRLPRDLPRLNAFPEWFTVEAGELYRVHVLAGGPDRDSEALVRLGSELIAGLPLELDAGETRRIVVEPLGPPPYGEESGPIDPFAALDAGGGDPALIAAVELDGDGGYAGESYRWTKRAPVQWRPQSGDGPVAATLWLRWGAKNDVRRGRLRVGARSVDVEHGGYDGFDWIAVDLPASWWSGDALELSIEPSIEPSIEQGAPGPSAFLSALRLRRIETGPAERGTDVRIEAEELEGDWNLQHNIVGYTGSGFRVSNAERIAASNLRRELSLPAGRVNVWARGYEGDGQDRRFQVSVGGAHLEPTHRGRAAAAFRWQLAGCVETDGGPSELEVRDVGTGFEVVDAVWVTSDLAFDPGVAERVRRALAHNDKRDPVARVIEECSESAERAHERIASHQTGPEEWGRERARLGAELRSALGLEPLPPRTPLNVRTLGTLERDGYRVERVAFESRPGFVVTSNVYVPEGGEPGQRFPAVLCPVGHWDRAKVEPVVQARCIALAKLGYVALTYDPFGQGERDLAGNDHHEYFRSILVGWNNMSFMVWDTIRAIDYLVERPDVDPDRVACTGASGGGLNTLYAAAVDERIRVAVPVVYVTRLRELLETRHTHCPCSHVNGLARFMDMGDVAALIAPRPLLLLTAERDASFTPAGARAAAGQARGAYSLFGAGEQLEVRAFDSEHDYGRAMREALYGWLARHLKGAETAEPVAEPEHAVEPDPEVLLCFPAGRLPAGSATVRTLARERARELTGAGPRDGASIRVGLRRSLGDVPLAGAEPLELDAGRVDLLRTLRPGSERSPIAFAGPDGSRIAGWRRPATAPGSPLVVIYGEEVALEGSPLVAGVSALGSEVISLAAGPYGESELHVLATDSHLLGDALLARRARALASVLRGLREREAARRPLVCVAGGARATLVLLAAQAAWGEADAIGLCGAQQSLLAAFEGGPPAPDAYAWRLLEVGDLPELISAAGAPVARLGSAPSNRELSELLQSARGR
ncbi:MAG: prolyl oligopeptidase family serine peptidase [bacterium]|nr:prolyl oligopeptidase family serine peptidase [bacterium]